MHSDNHCNVFTVLSFVVILFYFTGMFVNYIQIHVYISERILQLDDEDFTGLFLLLPEIVNY